MNSSECITIIKEIWGLSMTGMLEILWRASLGFAILLILVRVIGNKQLGQLYVFTYISGIVIGSMVADILLHSDLNYWSSMFGVVIWVGFVFCVEFAGLKNVKIRELLDGQPIILVKDGKILYRALKKERLNIDDLTMMLRTNNVFSILDVAYGILEPNGDLSVLKKQSKETVTKDDMKIKLKPLKYIPTAVIIDGKIIMKNLTELKITESWINSALVNLKIPDKADVLYAEMQEDGQLHVQVRDDAKLSV